MKEHPCTNNRRATEPAKVPFYTECLAFHFDVLILNLFEWGESAILHQFRKGATILALHRIKFHIWIISMQQLFMG
jgi:hypothetical protein